MPGFVGVAESIPPFASPPRFFLSFSQSLLYDHDTNQLMASIMAFSPPIEAARHAPNPGASPSQATRTDGPPSYRAPSELAWETLAAPLAAAEAGLARLDASLAGSAVRSGWQARSHFGDACAGLALEGKLIHLEDLVLHDADMPNFPPTLELLRARDVLHDRRRIAGEEPGWSLLDSGLRTLRGRGNPARQHETIIDAQTGQKGAAAPVDEFQALLDGVDAAIAKSNKALEQANDEPFAQRKPLIYDPDFNEEQRLAEWRRVVAQTDRHPPTLQAAIALDAWRSIDPLEHQGWLGPLLVADNLRHRAKVKLLPCLNLGWKLINTKRRRADSQTTRLTAGLEAIAAMAELGLKEHSRLVTARRLMAMKLEARRSTSRLPALIEYVMSQPIVTTGMIAKELKITLRAAQGLVAELGLRELTGRDRYRGWGVL